MGEEREVSKAELWLIEATAQSQCRAEDAKLGFSFAEEIIHDIRARTLEEVAAKFFPEKIRRVNDAIRQRVEALRHEGECTKREIQRTEGRNH